MYRVAALALVLVLGAGCIDPFGMCGDPQSFMRGHSVQAWAAYGGAQNVTDEREYVVPRTDPGWDPLWRYARMETTDGPPEGDAGAMIPGAVAAVVRLETSDDRLVVELRPALAFMVVRSSAPAHRLDLREALEPLRAFYDGDWSAWEQKAARAVDDAAEDRSGEAWVRADGFDVRAIIAHVGALDPVTSVRWYDGHNRAPEPRAASVEAGPWTVRYALPGGFLRASLDDADIRLTVVPTGDMVVEPDQRRIGREELLRAVSALEQQVGIEDAQWGDMESYALCT